MDWAIPEGSTNRPATIQDSWYWTLAKASNLVLTIRRYGFLAETSIKGRKVFLLKPTTFMNLSGNAVRYWLDKEKIDQKRLLVISDDVALPLGAFRLKGSGSNGGHNGLGHIQQLIGTNYARLRMGIGNDFRAAHRSTGCSADTPTRT